VIISACNSGRCCGPSIYNQLDPNNGDNSSAGNEGIINASPDFNRLRSGGHDHHAGIESHRDDAGRQINGALRRRRRRHYGVITSARINTAKEFAVST